MYKFDHTDGVKFGDQTAQMNINMFFLAKYANFAGFFAHKHPGVGDFDTNFFKDMEPNSLNRK